MYIYYDINNCVLKIIYLFFYIKINRTYRKEQLITVFCRILKRKIKIVELILMISTI